MACKANKAFDDYIAKNKAFHEASSELKAISFEGDLELMQQHLSAQELAEADSLVRRLEALGMYDQAVRVQMAALAKAEQAANEQKKKNFVSTLDFIAGASASSNKTIAFIAKQAATAQAIIHTAQAVTVALASAPPPFNFILAGLVGAAGAAQIATIQGVQLAHGGMLMPQPGGVPAVMAEAGKREVAIPLDDDRTKDALADTFGGGGGLHVHIHAGAVVADRYSVDQFAEMIEDSLYRRANSGQSRLFTERLT